MWKLKLDANGNVVMQDGKPVYVNDKNQEMVFDIADTHATIARLNGEAKTHREAKEAAETALLPFKGLDPAAVTKALATVKNIDDKTLVDAGKVEEVRQAAITATKAEYEPKVQRLTVLEQQLRDEKIGGAFARSPLIVGDKAKLAIPADLVQARFGNHFTLGEDGTVTAKDPSGNMIYSKANPGKPAGFDEALEILVEQYPNRDSILKASGHSGGGAQGGAPGGGTGAKTWTRAAFEAADHGTRMARSKDGFKVVD